MNLNLITLILDLFKTAQRGSNCKTWYVLKSHFWLNLNLLGQNQNCICSPGKILLGPIEELVIHFHYIFLPFLLLCSIYEYFKLSLENGSAW